MAVAIKPLEDRIVLKVNEAEQKTASGLVIPPRRSHKKAPLLQLDQVVSTTASVLQWMSRLAMLFSSLSTAEPLSITTTRSTSFSQLAIY